MNFALISSPLVYVGDCEPRGSYVLRITVREHVALRFGRFKRGKLIDVRPGSYAYIGSAMAQQGATCLAKRLLRHATRTGEKPPHAIRDAMLSDFPLVGLADSALQPPPRKTLRWNVDHLLDASGAELVAAYVIRSSQNLEPLVGDMLEADRHTVVFERGLGAHDRRGSTYLLRVEADEEWWHGLTERLESLHEAARCTEV